MLLVEKSLKRNVNRIEDIKNFAHTARIKHIGIAHYVALSKEAELVADYFKQFFELTIIDCKCGNLSKKIIVRIGR